MGQMIYYILTQVHYLMLFKKKKKKEKKEKHFSECLDIDIGKTKTWDEAFLFTRHKIYHSDLYMWYYLRLWEVELCRLNDLAPYHFEKGVTENSNEWKQNPVSCRHLTYLWLGEGGKQFSWQWIFSKHYIQAVYETTQCETVQAFLNVKNHKWVVLTF